MCALQPAHLSGAGLCTAWGIGKQQGTSTRGLGRTARQGQQRAPTTGGRPVLTSGARRRAAARRLRRAADRVDEEVEVLGFVDRGDDVLLLQRLPLRLLRVAPRAQRELENEQLARLGEQHGRLGRDHAHVLVALHDALDAREREVVVRLERLLVVDRQVPAVGGGSRRSSLLSNQTSARTPSLGSARARTFPGRAAAGHRFTRDQRARTAVSRVSE
mmetsp:Transcript_11902/g.47993  ORF Transcript_11902/g.47993 Transcript_11902/m.47993 type:complete len:217 (-) Transcript_11902:289-939(-)